MKTSIILAEFVIVGILAIYGSNIIIHEELIDFNNYSGKDLSIINAIFIGSLAYSIGFVVNALAEKCFNGVRRSVEKKKLTEYKKKFNEKFIIDRMRYMIYEYASESAISRMEYHNSLLRIWRCICLEAIVFSTAMFLIIIMDSNRTINQMIFFVIFFCFSVLSFWAFIRRVEWFTKTTIYSFEALRRNDKWAIEGQDDLPDSFRSNPFSDPQESKHN